MTKTEPKSHSAELIGEADIEVEGKNFRSAQRISASRHEQSMLPRFYTVPDVAELLRVSVKTVRRWIEDDELSVHRFNRRIRISEIDLCKFTHQRRGK